MACNKKIQVERRIDVEAIARNRPASSPKITEF